MPTLSFAPPDPPRDAHLLSTIRSSCLEASLSLCPRHRIALSPPALDALVAELAASPLRTPTPRDYGLSFPLQWDSTAAQVNFLSLYCVLSSLSPLARQLALLPGKPSTPSLTVAHLLLGLYLSSPPANHATAASASAPLSAAHLADLSDGHIADVLNLEIHTERPVAHIPIAVLAERAGPASDVVTRLREGANRVGEALVDARYVDLGAVVLETLAQCSVVARGSRGEEEAVGHFVNRMVALLPTDLADAHTLPPNNTPVHIYKNALYLLLVLTLRFGASDDGGGGGGGGGGDGGDTARPTASRLPWLPSSLAHFPLLPDLPLLEALLQRGLLVVAQDESEPESKDEDKDKDKDSDKHKHKHKSDLKAKENPPTPTPTPTLSLSPDRTTALRAAALAAGQDVVARLRAGAAQGQGRGQGHRGWTAAHVDAYLRRAQFDKGKGKGGGEGEGEGEGEGCRVQVQLSEGDEGRTGCW